MSFLPALNLRSPKNGIPRCLRKSRFLFIHIPKTGGMSIARAIYGRPVWHRTALAYLESEPDFFRARTSFTVVRNPWDRAVSMYEYSRSGGSKAVALDVVPPEGALRSFEHFVFDFIVANRNQLRSMDEVFRPQHLFVNDRQSICLVDIVGRFERLGEFELLLLERGAIRRPIRHLNASTKRATKDYRLYYSTPRLVDAVAECYACDIGQFVYEFDSSV